MSILNLKTSILLPNLDGYKVTECKKLNCIALIPARSGSKRLPDKNINKLAGHPLIAYTISAARESGVFSRIIVSTDDEKYASIARHYGAETPFMRPNEYGQDKSSDIDWVLHALIWLKERGETYDAFFSSAAD